MITYNPNPAGQMPPADKPMQPKNVISPVMKVMIKVSIIAVISLVLLIPLQMTKSLIRERETTSQDTKQTISAEWGDSKVLSVAVYVPYTIRDGRESGVLRLSPDAVTVKASVRHHILNIGRYDMPVYDVDISLSGNMTADKKRLKEYICFDRLNLPLDDIKLDYSNMMLVVLDRSGDYVVYQKTLPEVTDGSTFAFDGTLSLKGSEALSFVMAGKYDVEIDGDTPNPNLRLGRIPDTRNVTDSGFTARWKGDNKLGLVSYMHTRQQYFETLTGVEIMPSVSQYQMTMRTVKYAMLIIVLTFVAFMLVELWRQKSVNPLQYVLIGLALVLFYTLLLSFSEYMNFSYAYLIAAVMTGGLSTAYTASVFRDWRTAVILALILASLYLYIYILTQIESYSLLAGSIGLFVILAVVMFSSQKIFNKQG